MQIFFAYYDCDGGGGVIEIQMKGGRKNIVIFVINPKLNKKTRFESVCESSLLVCSVFNIPYSHTRIEQYSIYINYKSNRLVYVHVLRI